MLIKELIIKELIKKSIDFFYLVKKLFMAKTFEGRNGFERLL